MVELEAAASSTLKGGVIVKEGRGVARLGREEERWWGVNEEVVVDEVGWLGRGSWGAGVWEGWNLQRWCLVNE